MAQDTEILGFLKNMGLKWLVKIHHEKDLVLIIRPNLISTRIDHKVVNLATTRM